MQPTVFMLPIQRATPSSMPAMHATCPGCVSVGALTHLVLLLQGMQSSPDGVLANFKGAAGLAQAAAAKVSSYSLIKAVAAKCSGPADSMTRLRLLNTAGLAYFRISVDNHR